MFISFVSCFLYQYMQKSSSFIFATSIEPCDRTPVHGGSLTGKQQRSGKYMCRIHVCDTTHKKTCCAMGKYWERLRKREGGHVRWIPLLAAVGLGLCHTHMTAVQLGHSLVLPWEPCTSPAPSSTASWRTPQCTLPPGEYEPALARLKCCLSRGRNMICCHLDFILMILDVTEHVHMGYLVSI